MISHAYLPFMHSVWDQNIRKITVADLSTGHIAVTTPCLVADVTENM